MPRRRKQEPELPEPEFPELEPYPAGRTLDANQVVAYNFRAARELRGWTQEETARRMAPYLGQELPKASISGIERSYDGERRRFFDAQELVAFSLAFDLPIAWFFLPPPWMGDMKLAATDETVLSLVRLLYGRDNQQERLQERIAALREADPRAAGEVLAEAGGFPPEVSWEHFQRSREEALFALVEEETTQIEQLVGDLRRVLDRFDDLSMRTHYDTHPRAVYKAISHSIIGERVFRKVMFTHDPAHDGRYTYLRMKIASPDAIERVIDLDDPETVARLAAVYDRAEELLQQRVSRESSRGRSGKSQDEGQSGEAHA